MLSRVHIIQTLLYMTEFCLAYAIMLAVMTFNLYLFIGVIAGAMLGFQLCTIFSRTHIMRRAIGGSDEKENEGKGEKYALNIGGKGFEGEGIEKAHLRNSDNRKSKKEDYFVISKERMESLERESVI